MMCGHGRNLKSISEILQVRNIHIVDSAKDMINAAKKLVRK
jgi:trans-aconitate methyltransferase